MFEALIRLSLRYRNLTLGVAVAIVLAGANAWLNLPIDAFPDISPTQAKLILKVPGMTPVEIEQRVVKPIEQELLSIPDKQVVRSMSKYGIADITIDFEEGVDIYWARQQVSEHLASVMRDLPPSVTGGLAPITTPLSEMFMFTIEGEGFSLADKRRVLDWVIRPELRTIAGVADVNSLGGEVQSFEVLPNTARMAALGLSMADLRQALEVNNSNDGAGRIVNGEESFVVRVVGAVQSLDDLRSIRLPTHHGDQKVYLDDVATVRLGALTRYGAVTQNGEGEAVQGLVLGMRGANARDLVTQVSAKLQDIQTRLPQGMSTRVFYNRGELVTRAANTVIEALVEAAVLVCIVLYVFLGGIRAAVVVAVSLPLALMSTFVMMKFFGLTANLMSLGGLAIALGMLVDASVVVVENIETALAAHATQQGHAQGLSKGEVLLTAVRQVVKPVVAGVLIIGVVFLPLLSLQGLEGKLFAPVALTIIMALAASLLIAFTIVVALSSWLLRSHGDAEPRAMQAIHRGYVRLRDAVWQRPRWLYGASLASLVLAVGVYSWVGKTFMPTMDEGDVIVQLEKTPSIALDASLNIDTRVQQAILQHVPEVKTIVARTGSDELGLDPMGFDDSDTFIILKPKSEWRGSKEDVVDSIRTVLEGFPGVVYGFTQPIEMRVSEMLTGTRGDVAIKVFGTDLEQIQDAAQRIADAVRHVSGAAEVIAPKGNGLQYLTVNVNRTLLGQSGFSVEAFQQALKNQIEGESIGYVLQDGVRVPLTLKGNEALRNSPEAFKNLQLLAPDGHAWRAETLADFSSVDGPIRVNHEQSARFTSVQVSVEGRDLGGFVQEAQQAVAQLKLPAHLRVVWGGQFENQQRASARLALVIPAALTLIFVILVMTFGSVVQAGIIFLNIPFALVGGIFALGISGEYLSVPASVGFIALLGIAVLNGVVMVTHFNERLMEGEDLATVVRRGTERRLRPVLMTAVITALGMIPLLFASGPGSEIQRPLAIVVTGGLVTSTLLTLLLLPKIFERFGSALSLRDTLRLMRQSTARQGENT
jgi:CzcA family heavy metal efflux pump